MIQKHFSLGVFLLAVHSDDVRTYLLRNVRSLMVNGVQWDIIGSPPPHRRVNIHWASYHLPNTILQTFLSQYGEVAGIRLNKCFIEGDSDWNKVQNGIRTAYVSTNPDNPNLTEVWEEHLDFQLRWTAEDVQALCPGKTPSQGLPGDLVQQLQRLQSPHGSSPPGQLSLRLSPLRWRPCVYCV